MSDQIEYAGFEASEFAENPEPRVPCVLLLDVSGSVENYVNFIRKTARNFVDTVDRNDRISIVTFIDPPPRKGGGATANGRKTEDQERRGNRRVMTRIDS